jgi:hypothetical protein
MAQVRKSTPVVPSSPLRWHPYLGSEIHGLGTQARSGGNCTLGLKSMAQVLKPTPVAQVDANGRIQAHSGGTSPLRRQLYLGSEIHGSGT